MTFKEFQAWYEGYRESFADGIPSKKQLKEVERRMGEVVPDVVVHKESYPVIDWGRPKPYYLDEGTTTLPWTVT